MSKSRLLIVHPEPSALALLSSMLMSMGHEIDEAANDRMAVRLMERGGVDLMSAGGAQVPGAGDRAAGGRHAGPGARGRTGPGLLDAARQSSQPRPVHPVRQ